MDKAQDDAQRLGWDNGRLDGLAASDSEVATRLEVLLADRLARLLAATPTTLDSEIVATQKELCHLLRVDRSVLWQGSPAAPQTFRATHIYGLPSAPELPTGLVANEVYPWLTRQALAGRTIAIPDLDTLPPEAALDRQSVQRSRAKAVVAIPFTLGTGVVRGVLSFTSMSLHERWHELLLVHCRLVAQVLGSVLARAQADAARAESEARYRLLLEQLNVGVFLSQPRGPIQHANAMMVRICGYDSMEELLALPVGGLWAEPAARERFIELLARQGSVTALEAIMRRKDGSTRPVSINAVLLGNQLGLPEQVLGTVEDISTRKETEAALLQSEQLFSLFMQHSPIHVYVKEVGPTESRVVQASDSFKQMIGFLGEEMRGKTMAELFPPEFAAKINADDQAVIANDTVVHLEEEFDGRHYSTTKFPIQQGSSRLLAGYTVDITEQKRSTHTQNVLNALVLVLNATSDLREGLNQVLAAATELGCVDCGGIYLVDPDDGSLKLASHVGLPDEFIACVSHFPGDSPNTRAAAEGKPRYASYEEIRRSLAHADDVVRQCEGLRAFAMIPIMANGRMIALLNLASHRHDEIPPDIRVALEAMAIHVGGSLLRLRAYATLRETDAILSAFMESAVDGFYILDAELRFVMINSRALQVMGKKREAVLGKHITEIVPDVKSSGRYDKHLEVIRTGKPYVIDHHVPHPVFGKMHFSLISFKVGDGLGVIAHDITARVEAEEEVRRSELRFRSTFEQAFIGASHVGLDGRWLRVNQRLCDMLGYSREELLARNFQSLTHPDDVAADVAALRAHAAGELREYAREKRYLRKDGSIVWVSLVASLVRDEHGAPLYFTSFLQDITERKLAEEQLEMVRTSIDRAPIATFWVKRDGRIVYVNEHACRTLGYERDELRGQHVSLLNPKVAGPRWAEVFEQIRAHGLFAVKVDHRRKDGTLFPVEVTSWYFKHGDNEYCLAFIVDLTERLKTDQERAALQEQLNHAQRLESVGRLAGGVAHDFNNILSIIQMSTHLALEDVLPSSPLHGYLNEIRTAAGRSADLTRQLLAFARKQAIAPRTLQLNDNIESLLKMLRRLLGEDLELSWHPGPGLWPILMDPAQIDQLLANLCVNARDAITDVGKVVIETANYVVDEEFCAGNAGAVAGEYVRLRVSDNGCGMDAATRAHIFEPFFTTKGEGRGTGLGLATVYGIVTQNNGFLQVESEVGRGTMFTIYLPRLPGQSEATEAEPTRRLKPGRETILAVEDDPVILRLVTRHLTRLGYAVLATQKPQEAMRLARESSGAVDLLLLDVVMPGMNGRELASSLLALYPKAKCLYMSGYTADVIAHHGVLDRSIALLQKPFTAEELSTKVREVLDESRDD